jgi:hypothetical protein
MLARQQELNVQFHQLIDAFVLAFSLFAAHALRYYGTAWLDLPYSIDPFRNYQWLLIVIMPFGPILLDLQGFYQSPINKGIWKSFVQITRTMIYLSIMVSVCVIFLRLPLVSRAVPLLFILIATGLLLLKETIFVRRVRRRAARGQMRERVLLAGVPQDMAALEESLTREETILLQVAERIDIEKQPISDLVEAMHLHAVSRVIFAAGHGQLNRIEQAIRRLRAGRGASMAGRELHPNGDRQTGFRCFRRTPDACLSFNAGCLLGVSDQGNNRSRRGPRLFDRLHDSDVAHRPRHSLFVERPDHFPTGTGGQKWEALCDV